MYLWNYQFSKIPPKNLIDFCPERLFRLGMLCTQLSRVALRIIKTNHMHLVYKIFQDRNLSKFSVVFGKIDNSIDTFRHYLTFSFSTKMGLIKLVFISTYLFRRAWSHGVVVLVLERTTKSLFQ